MTVLCLGSGVPGELFTPTLAFGALLGAVLGDAWSWIWRGVPCRPGCSLLLAPHQSWQALPTDLFRRRLVMELTGQDRSFSLPVLLGVITATLVSRTIDRRSIYDARFCTERGLSCHARNAASAG
jgi:chloride channel protein, CIC family